MVSHGKSSKAPSVREGRALIFDVTPSLLATSITDVSPTSRPSFAVGIFKEFFKGKPGLVKSHTLDLEHHLRTIGDTLCNADW